MLRTGFEALLGDCDGSDEAAARLRDLFRGLAATDPTDHLLWSPHEAETLTYRWTSRSGAPREALTTPLEHWFRSFSEVRNSVVHRGASVSALTYEEATAYQGRYFWTAERLLREAILVAFGRSGYPDLWLPQITRSLRTKVATNWPNLAMVYRKDP